MLKLSIIGCGNVAKTMAFLWHHSESVEIIDVVNRSQASAAESVAFIGAGKPMHSLAELRAADIFIIGCGDDHIESCLDELLAQNSVTATSIVFHFSGAKSSSALYKAKAIGAKCASLHPVKSFAKAELAINTFADTYCGLEGDEAACNVIEKLVEDIGGNCFQVDSNKKLTYHAASVFSCNYLVALQELSIRAFEHSGIERELAMKILEPIVKETTNNIFELGTANALTGPIARGDFKLVDAQFAAVKEWDKDAADTYRLLGKLSVNLSDEKNRSDKDELANISDLFNR